MIVREEKKNVPGHPVRPATRRIGLAMSMLVAVVTLMGAGAPAWALVGGMDAGQGDFPSVVSIEVNSSGWKFIGAGVIIDDWNVLTSGNLVRAYKNNPGRVRIRAGNTCQSKATTVVGVQGIDLDLAPIPGVTYANDIAMLHLQSPLVFSADIQPAALPAAGPDCDCESPSLVGESVQIVGWGQLVGGGPMQDCAQRLSITVTTTAQANVLLGPVGAQTWDCQLPLYRGSGYSSAAGDGGDPVFGRDLNGDQALVGIISFGVKPYSGSHPSVSTRVSCYRCWINTHRW